MAEQLSEDLIIEILCRLPVKTMVGLKCVSKTWYTLISHTCFPRVSLRPFSVSGFLLRDYRRCEKQQHFMGYVPYFCDDVTSDGFVECCCNVLPSVYSPYKVLDCCNGLILIGSPNVRRYFVYNPATKQCVSVAFPQANSDVEAYYSVLAFNPCESPHYKVIRFTRSYPASTTTEFDIFSSETRKWTRHKLAVAIDLWVQQAVYWNGVLYNLTFSNQLLLFDLRSALITQAIIDLPCRDTFDTEESIGVSKGELFYSSCSIAGLQVWQLDLQSGRLWILKHSVTIYDMVAERFPYRSVHSFFLISKVYAVHPTSDIIFLGNPFMIFRYHLDSHKLELLYERPTGMERVYGEFFFYPYSPCFTML